MPNRNVLIVQDERQAFGGLVTLLTISGCPTACVPRMSDIWPYASWAQVILVDAETVDERDLTVMAALRAHNGSVAIGVLQGRGGARPVDWNHVAFDMDFDRPMDMWGIMRWIESLARSRRHGSASRAS